MIVRVANTAAETLKSPTAACTAAVLLAAVMALLTYLSLRDSEARAHEARMALIARCFPESKE